MRRMSLEANHTERSSPNIAKIANVLQNERCKTIKPAEANRFSFSNSEEISEEMPCQGLSNVRFEKKNFPSGTSSPSDMEKNTMDTLKTELSKCKRELNDYNNATKELEQKYMKINVELGELQQTHERFISDRSVEKHDSTDSCRDGSEFSLKQKNTQVFQRGLDKSMPDHSKVQAQPANDSNCTSILSNNQKKSTVEFTCCQQQQQDQASQSSSIRSSINSMCRKFLELPSLNTSDGPQTEMSTKTRNLDEIYDAILQAMGAQHYKTMESKMHPKFAEVLDKGNNGFSYKNGDSDIVDLQKVIANLKHDQDRYRSVIAEQQNSLQHYQTRCYKATQIMENQQNEIKKLSDTNKDLRNEVNKGIDELRMKVDAKLRQVAPLTERLNEEQSRYQKVTKENAILKDQKRMLQEQARVLKNKLEDINKKKTATMNRLKNAERDLRIFRNYNAALKKEKAKNVEELKKLKDKLSNLQDAHKRMLSRQRDMNDKHCRELQRRVCDLEQRLGRSNNSTSSLLQERDRLISELQSQINTLVHNFEVSQKHIRLLRRHLHNAAGDTTGAKFTPGNVLHTTPITAFKRKPLLKGQL